MAASISLDDGLLMVYGTEDHDAITIEYDSNDPDEVRVTVAQRYAGIVLEREDYDRDDIDRVQVYALGGNDQIVNRTEITSWLWGEDGEDSLIGGSGNDYLYGGLDSDMLVGGRGTDYLYGGNHADVVDGGPGDDVLSGGTESDTYLFSGANLGSDVVREVICCVGADGDTVDFSSFVGPVSLSLAVAGPQVVNPGNLTLEFLVGGGFGYEGVENVVGSAYDDQITGNSRRNVLSGLGGIDRLFGQGGDDTMLGGKGDDWLYGETGKDVLNGEKGNDHLYGGDNDDLIWGGDGDDWLYGEPGLDKLYGEAGRDTLDGGYDGYADLLEGGLDTDTFVQHHCGWLVRRRWTPEDMLRDINPAQSDRVRDVYH